MTTLTRMAPGAVLPLHEHVEIEQTFVLEGRLVDDEGEVRAGAYVAAGRKHRRRQRARRRVAAGDVPRPNRFL